MTERRPPWYTLLNKYHWFVLAVAALGWLFDTMDQQLFTLARAPAMNELLASASGDPPSKADVDFFGPLSTAVFLMGWATGGLFFGVLGDRIGRAKTMLLTILLYSFCTGLSAFSVTFYDFAFYRFITGLGVGGEFAVGVALVAEVMPALARPFALGLLQALSAVGNITAGVISLSMTELEATGVLGKFDVLGFEITAWRAMFLVGTLPALLAVAVRGRLKEPDTWRAAKSEAKAEGEVEKKKFGSYRELLGDSRWRKRAFVGLALAMAGVIGVWGIGFFSPELVRGALRRSFDEDQRSAEAIAGDRDLIRLAIRDGAISDATAKKVRSTDLINSTQERADAQPLWSAAIALRDAGTPITLEALLDQTANEKFKKIANREELAKFVDGDPVSTDSDALAAKIESRSKAMNGELGRWAAYGSMMMNVGAFFGMYCFGLVTDRIGRRATFLIAFIMAASATAFTFASLDEKVDMFWMMPIMGFCLLAPFGGYAIYFPELFPTHLRSTGTSFCYNVGRFLAASGPAVLGLLTSQVFGSFDEPLRWAGISMCSMFAIGILALPFAPETKGQPLPEG